VRSEKAANDSAMAWLLGFADADFCRQQALLQAFRDQDDDCMDAGGRAMHGAIAEHAFDYRLP